MRGNGSTNCATPTTTNRYKLRRTNIPVPPRSAARLCPPPERRPRLSPHGPKTPRTFGSCGIPPHRGRPPRLPRHRRTCTRKEARSDGSKQESLSGQLRVATCAVQAHLERTQGEANPKLNTMQRPGGKRKIDLHGSSEKAP